MTMTSPERPDNAFDARSAAIMAALGLVVVALVAWRYSPPSPVPAEAPALTFSADRAGAALRMLLDGIGPHPVGSPANALVRERLIAHLSSLGFEPEVQETRSCGRYGTCADVANVLVRIEGADSGGVVLLSAHYDSVPQGPGASDNGVGVAALLEIARMVRAGLPLRHDLVLLFDDGEERGLLGAEAFVRGHRWASEVRAVVNLEARGTSGPSLMFENTAGGGWLVTRFASQASRPTTNAIAATVYSLLPNDTDLTVFAEARMQGLNFGFLGDPLHYHTPRDDLAHVSAASLQHHGDNALAALIGLQEGGFEAPGEPLIFFDVLTLFVVRWPVWVGWLLVLVGLVASIGTGVVQVRRGRVSAKDVGWGLLAFPAVAALALFLGALGQLAVRAATDALWIPSPGWLLAVFYGLAVVSVSAVGWGLRRRAGFWGLWLGVWVWWGAVALALLATLPGMSYPMTAPLLIAGLCGAALSFGKAEAGGARPLLCALPWAISALLWCPIPPLFYDAMGHGAIAALPVMLALAATAALPALSAR